MRLKPSSVKKGLRGDDGTPRQRAACQEDGAGRGSTTESGGNGARSGLQASLTEKRRDTRHPGVTY